ncbi:hypothetical protein [Streptosporangium sp. NPDC048865]|uniref:hypothetical protein n=1 Tax=Streptosporangium sp. NPDC048865 TaxID=3155766 RepID=UPI003416D177
MKKGDLARVIVLAGTSVVLSFGLGVPGLPSASGASGRAAVTGGDVTREPAPPAANECGLPTSVRPGSTYVTSRNNCYTCLYEEVSAHARYPWRDYYCTYNPHSDLNELHYVAQRPAKGAWGVGTEHRGGAGRRLALPAPLGSR